MFPQILQAGRLCYFDQKFNIDCTPNPRKIFALWRADRGSHRCLAWRLGSGLGVQAFGVLTVLPRYRFTGY